MIILKTTNEDMVIHRRTRDEAFSDKITTYPIELNSKIRCNISIPYYNETWSFYIC